MSDSYPLHDLTGFQRELLAMVAKLDEPHGLAIKDKIEEYHASEVHHSRLYPNLDELVDKGFVEKGAKDRRTNSYSVTKRGERELQSHVELFTDALEEKAPVEA